MKTIISQNCIIKYRNSILLYSFSKCATCVDYLLQQIVGFYMCINVRLTRVQEKKYFRAFKFLDTSDQSSGDTESDT